MHNARSRFLLVDWDGKLHQLVGTSTPVSNVRHVISFRWQQMVRESIARYSIRYDSNSKQDFGDD